MLERAYRKRLDADLARWQSDGTITPTIHDAIRATLPPLPAAATIATVVAIVGGLLIAAAFLAFVAANWDGIARPARFAILLAGIAGAHGLGALFARSGRPILADLSVSVGAVIFGAAIALTGQMYHLSGDFAGALLLWGAGALTAAVLTGSRGALAVALGAAVVWSIMRIGDENAFPHLPFLAFWAVTAVLAFAWNAAVARHLTALAATGWWIAAVIAAGSPHRPLESTITILAGLALLFGAGEATAGRGPQSLRSFGTTLSTYAGFAFAGALAFTCVLARQFARDPGQLPQAMLLIGLAGVALAASRAVMTRGIAPVLAALFLGLGLLALVLLPASSRLIFASEPWLFFALCLAAPLALVVSGLRDDARPRVIAGWLGLGATIAAITWSVEGSLLARSAFLAIAGAAAVVLALLLGRLMKEVSR